MSCVWYGGDVANHLARHELRLDAVLLLEVEGREDRPPGLPHVGLGVGMDLEHPVQALDDQHPGPHVGRF